MTDYDYSHYYRELNSIESGGCFIGIIKLIAASIIVAGIVFVVLKLICK